MAISTVILPKSSTLYAAYQKFKLTQAKTEKYCSSGEVERTTLSKDYVHELLIRFVHRARNRLTCSPGLQ